MFICNYTTVLLTYTTLSQCPLVNQQFSMEKMLSLFQPSALPLKGAGSYLAGMAVAIPILNVDGRRHTNNFSKNI